MFNYNTVVEEGLRMFELSDETFNESQRVRIDYILYAKQSGDNFLKIKQALQKATRYNPIELSGVGTFTSFQNFLEHLEETRGVKASTIKEHVILAENWDIVLKLGMQDKENVHKLKNCMRVARTLKVIRWYKAKVKAGVPEELLTLELYWEEEEARVNGSESDGLTKRQLQQKVTLLECRVAELEAELMLSKQSVPQRAWTPPAFA